MQPLSAIPHPPRRLPILGDVLGIDSERPNQKTLWQFGQLGPLYRRTILGTHLTFVGSAELAAATLDEASWERYSGRPITRLQQIAGAGLFTAANDSTEWTVAHRVLAEGFTQQAMRQYHDRMTRIAGQAIETLAGRQRNVEVFTNQLALEVIGQCGFGYSFGPVDASRNSANEFASALARSLAHTQGSAIPLIGALTGGRRQFVRDRETLHRTIDSVLAAAPEDPDSDLTLLRVMLESNALSHSEIRDQIITFLIAGHETTGNLLAFALHYLSRTPEAVHKMRKEREAIAGDQPLEYGDVARLRYTRAVIDETLRLWPTAPGFFRVAKRQTSLGDFVFQEGDWVFNLMLSVHRDPQVWQQPEDFVPQRFVSGTPRGVVYRPFGSGPRACIGRQFALHEAAIVLSEVVRRYQLEPLDDSELAVDENLTLRPREVGVVFS
ncbi:cytochrome P450 [uncultured Gordonia sp.]|uniref:cytochrome P450 n=1 Tax=uncultured Gordonia sp. TaxID=198437 RepID=UPI0025931490|nr:cytochrome P450 [uncultured Gordonia sp.]